MNKLLRLLLSLMALFLISQVTAEEAPKPASKTAAKSEAETPEQKSAKVKEKSSVKAKYVTDYQALPASDPKLEVRNVSYLRKVASSGRGEFLDVQFNLYNKDIKTKEYSVYVLAVNEGKLPTYYPAKWRENDPQGKYDIIRFQTLAPELIKEDDVLKTVANENIVKDVNSQQEEAILNGTIVREKTEPNFDDYITYLTKNQDKALKVKVFGHESPASKEQVDSNIKVDEAELNRDVNYKSEEQTYTIQANKYFTTVTTHHFSIYRPEFLFYNKVLILVFDPARPKNKLVYRGIHNIGNKKLKS